MTITPQGQITYLVKIFGRGSDFVCRDLNVRRNGGVHVLQTFFSEDIAEQVQIRGRTYREDDPGSYNIIAFQNDLPYDLRGFSGAPSLNPYSFLSERRRELSRVRDKEIEGKMNQSIDRHQQTMFFSQQASSRLPDEQAEALNTLARFQHL